MFGSRSIECNIAPLVGAALVSGGAGILSGLFGSSSKAKAQAEANATNLQIARETNKMQYDMNRQNNMFNAEEAQKAWQRQVDMFNMENEYNTPAAQRARMEEAGFNPFVGQSGSMAYGAAADGGGAPAASAGTSGISPVMAQVQPVPSVWNGISDALLEGASSVANAYANIAQAEKAGVETETLKRVMDSEVELKKANADWWRMNADLYSKYGNLEMSKKMATMDENLNNIIADTGKKIKEGILSYEQAMKTIEETGYWKEAKELKGKEKDFFQAKLDRVSEFIQNEIDEGKARINELDTRSQANVASADAARASAKAAIASAAVSYAQAHGIRIQNDYLVDKIERELAGMDVDQLSKIMTTLFDTNKFSEGGKVSGPFGLGFSWNDTKSHSTGDDNENYARFVLDAIRKAVLHKK